MVQRPLKPDRPAELSVHILPSAATMTGVCTTLIGLVKVVERRIGPSHVDEYVGLVSLLFVVSAIASYISLRYAGGERASVRFERIADVCFMIGLLGLALIALLFAYEAI
jgi:hypothetical protein